MTTTVDALIAFDCASSMNRTWEKLRPEFFDPLTQILRRNSRNLRLGLVGFRSDDDQTDEYGFTSSDEAFQQTLDQIRIVDTVPRGPKGVALALEDGLTFNWRREEDDRFSVHEKFVILFTDGPPCGLFNEQSRCRRCEDLWLLADEYLENNISIIVVGVEPEVNTVDDFYCGLAKKTGGVYFPLVNGPRILLDAISRSLGGEHTVNYLFRQLDVRMDVELNSDYHSEEMKNRVDFILKYCRTMTDVRRELYWYLRREVEPPDPIMSPPPPPSIQSVRSAPIWIPHAPSDDEGYRSRLPTVASNTSLLSMDWPPFVEHSPFSGDELDSSSISF